MTPQELRTSVFQFAVQGKLVEQRPEEGTGEELFQQIQAEKRTLINAGVFKKDKPLPKITEDEIPFDIPDAWRWVRLDDVVTKSIKRGKSPTYAAKSGTLVFAQKCNTKAGYIDLDIALFLDESKLEKYPKEEFMQDKDIVINSTGNGTLGRVGVYRDTDNPRNLPIVPDSHVTVIRATQSVATEYVYYVLKYYQPYMEKLGTGSTNQTELSANVVRAMLFPLPPLAEQKRIVAKLEEILPLIDRYEVAWNKLEEFNKRFPGDMQKSILQLAIQGKLVEQRPDEGTGEELFQQIQTEKQALIKAGKIKKGKLIPAISDEEIPFEIPENWTWVRLSEICDVSDGTHQTPKYVEKGMPFISAQNVKPYRFMPSIHRDVSREDYEMYNKNVAPEKGDILMTRVGAGIGEAAIIDVDMEFSIYVSLTLIKCFLRDYDMRYLLYVLNSPHGRKLAEKKTLGKGASQGNLNLIFIREFLVPLPPIEEQNRIVAKLEEILPLCDRLK